MVGGKDQHTFWMKGQKPYICSTQTSISCTAPSLWKVAFPSFMKPYASLLAQELFMNLCITTCQQEGKPVFFRYHSFQLTRVTTSNKAYPQAVLVLIGYILLYCMKSVLRIIWIFDSLLRKVWDHIRKWKSNLLWWKYFHRSWSF